MKKEEFLKSLEKELKIKKHKNYKDVIDYYDELIEDKKETGKKEEDIIGELSSIKKIVSGVKLEKQIEIAEEKPTVSNGLKALISMLGILSIPMLIPVGAVIFAGLITIGALLFSLIVVILAFLLSAIIIIIALFVGLFLGKIPFVSFVFFLGTGLIFLGLVFILTKWIIEKCKQFTSWFIAFLRRKFNKKRGEINE